MSSAKMESSLYKLENNRRIMAILAHPDDEVIACGGLLAKTVQNGGEGFVYILTSNETRRSELKASCQILRVNYVALNLKEKEFGFSSFNEDFLLGIEKTIADFRPHVLVTHDQQYDYHADHRKTAELVIPRLQSIAMGSQGEPWIVELILAAEVNNLFPQPDILVDITDSYKLKQQALEQHRSQVKCAFKEEYYSGLVKYKALLRGHQMGTEFAEAFMIIKQPIVGNFYTHQRGPFL